MWEIFFYFFETPSENPSFNDLFTFTSAYWGLHDLVLMTDIFDKMGCGSTTNEVHGTQNGEHDGICWVKNGKGEC